MAGPVAWRLYYAESGNAKNGTLIASGTVPALGAGESYTISAPASEGTGNYIFKIYQRPGHPGQGVLWSNAIAFDADDCATPTSTPTPGKPSECHVCPGYLVFQLDRGKNIPNIIRSRLNGLWGIQLTHNGANVSPTFNFPGSQIAFASNRDGDWEIYRMNRAGGNEVNVTHHSEGADLAPSWECFWIAFQSDRDGNWEIYKTDPSGSEQIRLTDNPAADEHPAWAPDSQRIAFTSNRDGNWDLYVMDQDGRNVQRLTDHPAIDRNPTWSTDGQFMAFESNRDGQFDIYKLNLASGEVTRLTETAGGNTNPVWMPYCDHIFFQSERDNNQEIYRMLDDGSEETNIRKRPDVADALSWWPE